MTAPIKNSCPDIDKGIAIVKQIAFYLDPISRDIKSYSINDIEEVIDNVLAMSSDIEMHFEEARSVNSDLRSWAEEEVEKKEKEIEMLREELEDLEMELEDIRQDYHI
jgi:spore cortex formation protein SpoVR/YcgB (stage V sporulation)